MLRLSSSGSSGMKQDMAVMPSGMFVVGRTSTFLDLQSFCACCAARIMFLLLGRMTMAFAGTDSMASSMSSVLGFMVCPP